jgi:hypothetical protein
MSSHTIYSDTVADRWSCPSDRRLCVGNEGIHAAPAPSTSLFLAEGLDEEEASPKPIYVLEKAQ